jgi:tetratricopeptide (TPR) repeat protein
MNFNEMLKKVSREIELEPNNKDLRRARIKLYSDNSMLDKTIPDFNKLIELEPTARNYTDRGYIYANMLNQHNIAGTNMGLFVGNKTLEQRKKNLLKAKDDYDRAVELDPTYLNAYFNRGLNYFDLEMDELALKDALFLYQHGDTELLQLLKQEGL